MSTQAKQLNYTLITVILFAVAFGYLEAAVVTYLRDLYYPEGFQFPVKALPTSRIAIELVREFATLVMVTTVGILAGRTRWEKFGYFLIIFGIWDIFFYISLKLTINWPSSFLEWDLLFLLPIPWIGPVIAPILVSLLMIVCGYLIVRLYHSDLSFHPGGVSWILASLATCAILWSFMRDSSVVITEQMPQPYSFLLLYVGLVLYIVAFLLPYRAAHHADSATAEET